MPHQSLSLYSNRAALFFRFEQLGTSYRTEILAGITTFITLAYTLVVTPSILSSAIFLQQPGDLFDELVVANSVQSIQWNDLAEAIPAFLMLLMPLTFSIADGIAIGFITYPLLKVFQGKARELNGALIVLALLAVLFLVLMTGQKG